MLSRNGGFSWPSSVHEGCQLRTLCDSDDGQAIGRPKPGALKWSAVR